MDSTEGSHAELQAEVAVSIYVYVGIKIHIAIGLQVHVVSAQEDRGRNERDAESSADQVDREHDVPGVILTQSANLE